MGNLAGLSAAALVRLIKEKKISSLELLEYYIERYERLNPRINAIVAADFDSARKRAGEADAALAGDEDWGPLHGLPMTLKDNIDVAGMPATYGSPRLKDFVPTNNSDTAQFLRDAGAIIFGKTNLPLFAMDYQSYNDVYGQTNNPWDVTMTPGGSSGGAAAALAAGLTGLEIGNDIGGSIRVPAHFCGVYGHKPSYGIVSMSSRNNLLKEFIPGFPDTNYLPATDVAVQGPLARSAEDLGIAMEIIVGPPSYQRKALKIELPPPRKTELKDFRVGLWLDDPAYPPDAEVGKCLQGMVERLEKAGVNFVLKKPDIDLVQCRELHVGLMTAAISHSQPQEEFEWALEQSRTLKKEDHAGTAGWIKGLTAYHRDWHYMSQGRAVIRQKWEDYFKECDVLLCPVERIAAFTHDHSEMPQRVVQFNDRQISYDDALGPWSSLSLVACLPATVVPTGLTSGGLPVGMQIIGPYLEDFTTIEFAKLLENEGISSFKLPPGYES